MFGAQSGRQARVAPTTEVLAPAPAVAPQPAVAPGTTVPAPTPSLADAVESTRDAVVNIGTERSLGAGVIVHSRGIVVTNYHVIADALEMPSERWSGAAEETPTVTARFENGRELPATVLVADGIEDLAILRLVSDRPSERFAAVSLGNSSALRVGQDVFAIGNPFGLNHSVSRGIIAARDRTDVMRDRPVPLLQLDAAINLGNSGGPLFDFDGALVGIVTSRQRNAEGIAFAVPVDHVRAFLDAVSDPKTPRSSGAIGLMVRGETAGPDGARLGHRAWLDVSKVMPDSTAAAAGLQPGDAIVALRGKRLDGLSKADDGYALAEHLVMTVRSSIPGERLPLTLIRGGQLEEVSVEIGSVPPDQQVSIDSEELLGLELRPGQPIPVVGAVKPHERSRLRHDPRGYQIVRLVDEPIRSTEALGAELTRLRELLRQSQGSFSVLVGLRDPRTSQVHHHFVLVQ